ncbi:hypothetical protein AB0I28_12515 [Phytomonospora sp. NPDC050363]|uniref:hypothetical protein n=1 Tax=Phytomonospora sp. NPDC050363 TaxID=3155642 RepID=UPI0033C57321
MEELGDLRLEKQLTREQADNYVADWCVKWRPFTFRAEEVDRWSPNIHDVIDNHNGHA